MKFPNGWIEFLFTICTLIHNQNSSFEFTKAPIAWEVLLPSYYQYIWIQVKINLFFFVFFSNCGNLRYSLSWAKTRTHFLQFKKERMVDPQKPWMWMQSPNIISTTSHKCIIHYEAAWCGFPRMGRGGLGANHHGHMSCFDGGLALISANRKTCTMKHALGTRTLKPTTHRNMSSFNDATQCAFRWPRSSNLQNM